jgi:Na+-transporting methylmalonyl-CoA/oxaloacetate decarboxylase gamma subunit
MKFLRSLAFAMTAVSMLVGFSAPLTASAQNTVQGQQNVGSAPNPLTGAATNYNRTIQQRAGFGTSVRSLPEIIGNIVNIVLSFLGVLLLVYLIYAGFLWMTSGGDSKKADSAMSYIQNAIIGLIIILASFAISNFVISNLVNIQGS